MKKFYLFIFSISFISNVIGQGATFTDHGFIPTSNIVTGIRTIGGEFQSSMLHDNAIWVATNKGIWKNNLITQQWSLVGLSNKKISCIYKHPTLNKIFAGAITGGLGGGNTDRLFVSTDNGITWNPVNGAVTDDYYMILARPNNPNHLYASLSGFDFAISTDAGVTWNYFNNGSGGAFGYPVNIAFFPNDSNSLYFGSENPLDDAWIGRYTINASNPKQLDNFTYIITSQTWGNRRPNSLRTYSYTGNHLYVGHEGAFSKVNVTGINQTQFIYASNGQPNIPYTYIYGQWVDPSNTNHLVFGGAGQGNALNNLQLYETFDEGNTFYKYTPTFDLIEPVVTNIIDIGNNKLAIVLTEDSQEKVKLIVMQPQTLLNPNFEINTNVKVYPNPVENDLFIENMDTKISEVKILNSSGQTLLSKDVNESKINLELSDFEKGIYFLELKTEKDKVIKKILKK